MKSVAIVGRAATAALAPYDDKAWEIWTLAWVQVPRADLLFDIHHPSFKALPPFDTHYNSHKNAEYFERVNKMPTPVLCDQAAIGKGERQFHNGKAFPLDEVVADLPRCYLDCTVSYMLAYALHKGFEKIGLWGCHFVVNEEFRIQLPSVAWLIGLAEGRGVEIEIGGGSPLMASGYVQGRYGVDQQKRWGGGYT